MTRIVRWNPWQEVDTIRREFARMADQMARDGGSASYEQTYTLPLDAYHTDDAIVVQASLPGVSPDDISINIEDGVLTIRGEYTFGSSDENVNYVLRERRGGKFARSLRLNVPVNVEDAEAVFEHGELTLTLPKAPEAKPLTIPVKAAH